MVVCMIVLNLNGAQSTVVVGKLVGRLMVAASTYACSQLGHTICIAFSEIYHPFDLQARVKI